MQTDSQGCGSCVTGQRVLLRCSPCPTTHRQAWRARRTRPMEKALPVSQPGLVDKRRKDGAALNATCDAAGGSVHPIRAIAAVAGSPTGQVPSAPPRAGQRSFLFARWLFLRQDFPGGPGGPGRSESGFSKARDGIGSPRKRARTPRRGCGPAGARCAAVRHRRRVRPEAFATEDALCPAHPPGSPVPYGTGRCRAFAVPMFNDPLVSRFVSAPDQNQ